MVDKMEEDTPDAQPDNDDNGIKRKERDATKEEEAKEVEIDEGTARVAAFKMAFKDRLKQFGVRYQPGASESGMNFNRAQVSEKVADHNDSQRVSWITDSAGRDTFVGHDVSSHASIVFMAAS